MKVLLADDNNFYRCALRATLTEWGYETIAVGDGEAAWAVLEGPNPPKLAILDWMMPRADGLEVCRRLRAVPRPEPTYVIMLTSREGKANVVAALEGGADDFITKPFDREELAARLRVGRRVVSLQTSETVIYSFAQAVDGKSPYTRGHSDRVRRVSLVFAAHLGLSAADTDLLRRGASLHDIGKIAVPDAVLNKPGRLTDDEYAVIKQHPEQGVRMVAGIEAVRDVLPLIRSHHERADGRGYPDRLAGKDIPFLVKALSVADVYDALSSDRPYRAALSRDACLEVLRKDAAGGGLDVHLVEQFCAIPAHRLVVPADAVPVSRIIVPPAQRVAAPAGT